MIRRLSSLLPRPSWKQVVVSILIAGLGLMGARALSQVNQDITLMYAASSAGKNAGRQPSKRRKERL